MRRSISRGLAACGLLPATCGLLLAAAEPLSAAENFITGTATFEVRPGPGNPAALNGVSGQKIETFRLICDRYETTIETTATVTTNGQDHALAIEQKQTETERSLEFMLTVRIDTNLILSFAGHAERTSDGLAVTLTAPSPGTLEPKGDIRLPQQSTGDVLKAARRGDHTFDFRMITGAPTTSKDGTDAFRAEIGDPRSDNQSDEEALFAAKVGGGRLQRWPVKLTLLAPDTGAPVTTLYYVIYDNGFVLGGGDDLGSLHLGYELTDFKPSPPEPCP